MRQLITNSILLTISIIIVNWFLWYVKKKYGRRPSISASTKKLQEDSNQIYFYLFITLGVCVPLAFIIYNLFAAMATGMLFTIGIITGYNPNIRNDKAENFLHVALTNLAIGLAIVSIIVMNYWLGLIVFIYAIPCFILGIKKVSCHTWRIEVLIIWMIWTCLFLQKILTPLIELIIE